MTKLAVMVAVAGIMMMSGACSSSSSSVSSLTVSCQPASIESGSTTQCTATVNGTGKFDTTVTWRSSAGSINAAGVFTGQSVSSPTSVAITATSKENTGVAATINVTVLPLAYVENVTVACSPAAIQSGQTSQCTATVTGTTGYNPNVTWTASPGSVSSSGLLTAPLVPNNTQVAVTATSVADPTKSASTSVFVSPAGSVTGVTVNCALPSILSGQDSQCTAIVSGTGNFSPAVNWSANTGVVNPAGLYIAPTVAGTTEAVVTATAAQDNTKSNSAMITVNPVAPGNNVVGVVVDSGPTGSYVNGAFASVNICVPGTSVCQRIDHLLVDTGSAGVRLLTTAAGGELNLPLPQVAASDGNPLNECFQLQNGYLWGSIAKGDVQMGGEQASNVAVQVVGASASPVPASCGNGTANLSTLSALGANGVLGVGLFPQDCGPTCAPLQPATNVYFSCAGGQTCNAIGVATDNQVPNPVVFVSGDNNGVLLQLPAVAAPGATTVNGNLLLGVGTQSNNAVGSATAYTTNDAGLFTVTYNGTNYPGFISSGSNAFYFLNSSIVPQLPTCTGNYTRYYCPASQQALSATNVGQNGSSGTVNFAVDNAADLFTNNPSFAVFPTLGGPSPAGSLIWEWGLPFFYGRNVFIGIQGASTPLGSGPFWAY